MQKTTFDEPKEIIHVKRGPSKYTSAALTVRTRAKATGVGEDLRFNPEYFLTLPGVIKIIQLILAIVALSCISPPLTWFSRLFTFYLASTFAITVIFCFAYLVTLKNVLFPQFNWLLTELIITIIAAFSLLITAMIHIGFSWRSDYRYSLTYFNSYLGTSYFGTYITAGVFGILNSIAYAFGAYHLYKEWNRDLNTVSPVTNNATEHR